MRAHVLIAGSNKATNCCASTKPSLLTPAAKGAARTSEGAQQSASSSKPSHPGNAPTISKTRVCAKLINRNQGFCCDVLIYKPALLVATSQHRAEPGALL